MVNSNEFFKSLQEYLISDLANLEDCIDGKVVFIGEVTKNSKGEEIGGHYVDLRVDKVMVKDFSNEVIETLYSEYSLIDSGFYEEAYLQRLNYNDFLPFENHFDGVVDHFHDIYELRISEYFREYLNANLDWDNKIELFISNIILYFETNIKELKKRFTKDGNYAIYHYDGTSSNPQITNVMKLVLDREILLYDWLKEEFKPYHKILENFQKASEKPKTKDEKIWYKIAILIISGRLLYENSLFVFDNISYLDASKASEPIAEEILYKASSIRVYLTETVSNSKIPSDKNIFIQSRLQDLLELVEKYPNVSISPTFKAKIENLKKQ